MTMLTKKKRRSGHGFFSSSPVVISSPTNVVKLSAMDDPLPAIGHGATSNSADDTGKAVTEPLVEDLEQVHADEEHAPVQRFQQFTLDKTPDFQPLASHPVPIPTPPTEEEAAADPPPDFTHRGIHIPTRTSSNTATLKKRFFRSSSLPPGPATPPGPMPTTADSTSLRERSLRSSDRDSIFSNETQASSIATQQLGPLQARGVPDDIDRLSPLLEDDPQSFELTAPNEALSGKGFDLEAHSEQLFSRGHLQAIFRDTPSLLRFTSFLSTHRPKSVSILIYYLDSLKAMRAIQYANAVAEALEPIDGHEFTSLPPRSTVNAILEDKATQAFDILVRDDLPAFITHILIQLVSVSVQKRVTGNLPPLLREASEGLAEVFCVSDPSRTDNPIIFASEEFHRTTQYGVNFAIGRNCRFLQGPMTNRNTVARLRDAVKEGKEISEVFLNYRRDGSPFMNLLMMAPLLDSRGNLRYFIGAQVDVSGLVKDCTDLDAFRHYLDVKEGRQTDAVKDEFQELSEMFNNSELETVRKHGGNMHREHIDDEDGTSINRGQGGRGGGGPRLLLHDVSSFETAASPAVRADGRLQGVYKHYLLIRPAPSLRILFVSPSLRVPGILQSKFLDRIGGNTRVRNSVAEALKDSTRGVTAKIRWLSTPTANLDSDYNEEGRPRWIHCTPMLGGSGAVGVWVVILVDDEKQPTPARRFRQAPPVPSDHLRKLEQNQRQVEPQRNRQFSSDPASSGVDSDAETTRTHRLSGFSTHHTNGSIPRHLAESTRARPGSAMSDQRADQSIRRRSVDSSGISSPSRPLKQDGIAVTKDVVIERNVVDPKRVENQVSSRSASISSAFMYDFNAAQKHGRNTSVESVLTQDFAVDSVPPNISMRRTISGERGPFFSS